LKTRLMGTCPDVTEKYTALHCSKPAMCFSHEDEKS
jgi:hypothetical protein